MTMANNGLPPRGPSGDARVDDGYQVVEAFIPESVRLDVPQQLRSVDAEPVQRAIRNVLTHPNANILERVPTEAKLLAAYIPGHTEQDANMDYRVGVAGTESKYLLYFRHEHRNDLDNVTLAPYVRNMVGRINDGLTEEQRKVIQTRFSRVEAIAKFFEDWLSVRGVEGLYEKGRHGVTYSKNMVKAQHVLCNAMGFNVGDMLGQWYQTVEENYTQGGVFLTEELRKSEMMEMMDLLAGTEHLETEALTGPKINRLSGAEWQQYLHSLAQGSPLGGAAAEVQSYVRVFNGLMQQIDSTEACFKILAIRGMVFAAFNEGLKKEDLWLSFVMANQFLWQGYIAKQHNWFLNQKT